MLQAVSYTHPEPDLADWTEMVEKLRHPTQEVTVALVGKYIQLHDAYISVVEALKPVSYTHLLPFYCLQASGIYHN